MTVTEQIAVYTDSQFQALLTGLSTQPDAIIYSMDGSNNVLVFSIIQSNGNQYQGFFGTGGVDGSETQTAFLADITAKWSGLTPINVQRFI